MRVLRSPVSLFLALGVITVVVIVIGTQRLAAQAAADEALSEARSTTKVLARSVAQPDLPEGLVRGAGLALLPLAVFIFWLATRPNPPRLIVWVVIIGNLGWTAESFLTLGQSHATALGTAFVAAQAVAVLGLACLEYVGIRKAAMAAV